MEGSGAVGVARLRVGADLQQGAHGAALSQFSADVQRSEVAKAGRGFEVGTGVDEQADQLHVAQFGGPVKRGHAVALCQVDLGAFIEQRTHRLDVVAHGGIGDRRLRCGGAAHRRASITAGSHAFTSILPFTGRPHPDEAASAVNPPE